MFVMHESLVPGNEQSIRDAARGLYRLPRGLRTETRKLKIEEMDVRLVSDGGMLWVNTGDVQYDAHHGQACGAGVVAQESSDDDLWAAAEEMVTDVADQLIELETQ